MNMDQITQETLEQVKKAQTSGILNSTGLFGYDLSKWISLIPIETPFRNRVKRVPASEGAKFAIWRALLNVNSSQADPAVGFDFAGNLVVISEQDMQAPFAPFAVAGRVTQDAIDLAKGYADARAIATINVLNQLMMGEDRKMIGAQTFALATPATPIVTDSATGGSIAASTAVNVRVAARTGNNYFYGGSGLNSAQGTVTTSTVAASTHSATATVTAVKGAVAYDWFVAGFYYTTTIVNTVVITSIPTANQALPTNLPELSTVAPVALPTADGSGRANDYNGLLATLAGDYSATGVLVTPGTGTASGAVWTSLDGGTLTLAGGTITQIDALFLAIYQAVRLSPTALMMNAQQAQDIGAKILGTNSAVTYLQPTDANGRTDVMAGGFVGSFINKAAGGKVVPVEVHPHVPPGTIIARTDSVPFPGSNIGETCVLETLRDYADFSYGANFSPGVAGGGPREDFEVRVVSAFKNLAPVAMGVLQNIAGG
jgi:hypothetical protein